MHHVSSWRNPISIGIGTLFTIGIVALPATYRRPAAPTFVPTPIEEAEVRSWFGLARALELPGINSAGVAWRPAGPLQFDETKAGEGHLTGYLVEASDSSAVLQVDLHFGARVEPEFKDAGPGTFAEVSGALTGFGSLEGGLIQVRTGRDVAMHTTGQRGQISVRTEWMRLPSAGYLEEIPRKSRMEFAMDFSAEAIWGARGLTVELAGMEEPFELVAGGHLIEQSRGSAWLSAVIEQPGRPGNRFQLELSASRDSKQPLAMGHGEGSEGFWRQYDEVTGTLRGLDRMSGALLRLESAGEFMDVGGEGTNRALQEALTDLVVRVVSESDLSQPFDDSRRARVRVDLSLESTEYAFEATGDKGSRDERTYAMDLGELGDDFAFRSGGVFTEFNDGTARLSGELVRANNSGAAYYIDILLSEPEATDSPAKGASHLRDWTYSENSGPVDRSSWRAYSKLDGTLLGLRDRAGESYQLASTDQPFQLGFGANGRSLTYGGFGAFAVRANSAEIIELGHLSIDLKSASVEGLELAQAATWIEPLGLDLQLVSGGHLKQSAQGGAHISAVLARASAPSERFLFDVQLAGREHVAGSSSRTEFASLHGHLYGLEDMRGAVVELRTATERTRMGHGVAPDEASQGLRMPYELKILSQPDVGHRLEREGAQGTLVCSMSRTVTQRAELANALPSVRAPESRAFYLPGVAEDLYFPTGGTFVEFANGTAILEGSLSSASDPAVEFDVRIEFDERSDTGQVGETRQVFPASAYRSAGGPVDPSTWHSYGRARGILVGAGALAGSALAIERDGLALEVGRGANGRNLEFGAAGEFHLRLLSQPIGDWGSLPETYVWGELHLNLPRESASETAMRAQ